jgi:phosphatidylglycerophosphate synthase
VISASLQLSSLYPLKAFLVLGVVAVLTLVVFRAHHPFATFGPANQVTLIRAALVALIAGLIGERHGDTTTLFVAATSALVTVLDGVDGWLARRTGGVSAFGGRFDMEVDALLILSLSVLAWQYDKAGAWIVVAGLLRYLFVAAGLVLAWMRQPLPPSRRRQTVCVIQVIGFAAIILPALSRPASTWIAAFLLSALSASFLIDVMWLWRASRVRRTSTSASFNRTSWVTLAAALLLLDASVTFHNIWPTPAVGWSGEVSIELAGGILALVTAYFLIGIPSRPVRRVVAIGWLVLVIGRYLDVTAPALWGRTLNFYWDLPFLPDVAAMLARAAPPWLVVIAIAAGLAVLVLAYALLDRALGVVWQAIYQPPQRRVLGVVASILVLLFVAQHLDADVPRVPAFPTPVSRSFAKQVRFVVAATHRSQSLPASPSFGANLARVNGADVLLFFVESYGAVAYERPDFSAPLAPARASLDAAIHASGNDAVSAFVESPTFGGSSWYAHLTLLSGIEVRDPSTNALLMTAHRDTLPTAFARHGYRTVAMMPGLWYPWPEGAFYGFQDIYNGARLDYHGPSFGWWSLTDQFTLAALDEHERRRQGRAPLFVFFPTISTHTPFAPRPPYQPDWSRMLTTHPYDPAVLDAAYAAYPDWLNLAPSYVAAVSYAYETLAGYVERHAGEDFVMILIGDHQPPALVSGQGVPWDVPVHVITNRRDVLDGLLSHGFQRGLTPKRPRLGKMHELTPILLDALSSH